MLEEIAAFQWQLVHKALACWYLGKICLHFGSLVGDPLLNFKDMPYGIVQWLVSFGLEFWD
jgi:hypothetical protein